MGERPRASACGRFCAQYGRHHGTRGNDADCACVISRAEISANNSVIFAHQTASLNTRAAPTPLPHCCFLTTKLPYKLL